MQVNYRLDLCRQGSSSTDNVWPKPIVIGTSLDFIMNHFDYFTCIVVITLINHIQAIQTVSLFQDRPTAVGKVQLVYYNPHTALTENGRGSSRDKSGNLTSRMIRTFVSLLTFSYVAFQRYSRRTLQFVLRSSSALCWCLFSFVHGTRRVERSSERWRV